MKPRRWFQFHLLTLVLLTLATGILLGLNIKRTMRWRSPNFEMNVILTVQGWPWVTRTHFAVPADPGGDLGWHVFELMMESDTHLAASPRMHLALNSATALLILFFVILISESLLRRRFKTTQDSGLQTLNPRPPPTPAEAQSKDQ